MNENKNIVTICRVCLESTTEEGKTLLDKFKNVTLLEHINAVTSIGIKEDDGLPQSICFICLIELKTAVTFKNKCLAANNLLKSKNKVIKTETTNDIDVTLKEENELGQIIYSQNKSNNEQRVIVKNVDEDSVKESFGYACSEIFDDKHLPDLKLQCHDCGSFFTSKCKLRVHWKKAHLLSALICQICKMAFKSYKAYHTHLKAKRKTCTVAGSNMLYIVGIGKSRVFHCKECSYKTKKIRDMQVHLVTHSGERPFKCELCSNTYTQQSSLQSHKESAHKEYKMEVTCHFCGKFLKGRVRIYRHLKTHTDDKVSCTICKKQLSRKSFKPHMERHSGIKSYTCEKCAATFYTSAELCNHRRSIHNKHRYVYSCDLCEYKSHRSDRLKKHKRRHNDTNIPCTICGMFFHNIKNLTVHERIHFEEKKYSCPHCNQKFHLRDSVRKHIKKKHKCLPLPTPKGPSATVKDEIVKLHNTDVIEIVSSPILNCVNNIIK